ncbi:hypothetical protein [Sphingomonas sp. CCH10-B3]|uniref:hypothetical protein n=1 Tax=Sphingomonas sp. CCH10-B3 TaxID=1768757 RepID=UPI0008343A6D|nr:hypothetical protein [Sphingomonas sp. CCH10-B3]MBA3879303.1 hypothetical protein [Sphingobium sp.]
MTASSARFAPAILIGGALLPIGTTLFLAAMAPRFVWDIRLADRPILTFAIGMGIASIAFLGWALRFANARAGDMHAGRAIALIFVVGLMARIMLIPSTPILEDDYYRYQWDGAVTAAGKNPFTYPPARFVSAPGIDRLLAIVGLEATPPPKGYEALSRAGHKTLLRVNNPHIATIYPPLAQLGFAAGYLLTPWQLTGWKIIVLAAEMLTFGLLLGALRAGKLPLCWSALYWWHPLALKEFANSAHMDALLLPFLGGALWMVIAGRTRLMALFMAGAAAVKFWPLLIVPALLRRNRAAIVIGIMTGVLALVLVSPQLISASSNSGLTRYAADWQRNALVFPALVAAFGLATSDPSALARLLVAAMVIGWVAVAWRRDHAVPLDRVRAASTAILLLILLGPTGYPWYALWLAPFAVVQPRLPVLMLLAAAPAYYLDFWFQVRGNPADWPWIAPLLSAGPVWLALAVEAGRRRPA